MKIFEKYNFETKGNIISKDEFRNLDFCNKDALQPDKLEKLLAAADKDLVSDLPSLT